MLGPVAGRGNPYCTRITLVSYRYLSCATRSVRSVRCHHHSINVNPRVRGSPRPATLSRPFGGHRGRRRSRADRVQQRPRIDRRDRNHRRRDNIIIEGNANDRCPHRAPIPGAVLEIWHCDVDGDYSTYSDGFTADDAGPGTTFFRGSQTASADGTKNESAQIVRRRSAPVPPDARAWLLRAGGVSFRLSRPRRRRCRGGCPATRPGPRCHCCSTPSAGSPVPTRRSRGSAPCPCLLGSACR